MERLGLKLNQDKTVVVDAWNENFAFLGSQTKIFVRNFS
jgi:hypothetical protein